MIAKPQSPNPKSSVLWGRATDVGTSPPSRLSPIPAFPQYGGTNKDMYFDQSPFPLDGGRLGWG